MKLIILHGPPAVGKYTIAKKLKEETEYRLLHIHSIYDFLEDIFDKDNYEVSLEVLKKIALDVFEAASQQKVSGLIFTYAHLAEDNFSFAKSIEKRLKKYNVDIFFVSLVCDEGELRKRITNISRKKFKKTNNVKELDYLLSKKDYYAKYDSSKNLQIATDKMTNKEVVEAIIKYINK